jgi:antitoxin HigA-1
MNIQELINQLRPVHPGEILREDFIEPLSMSVEQLANALDLPAASVEDIVHERTPVTSDVALRLARYFSTRPEYWLSFQTRYDLRVAEHATRHTIERTVEPRVREEVAA